MQRFANPNRFMRLSARVVPWLAASTATLFAAGLYLSLIVSPPDYQQGESVRIMYVHVPSAWMALFCYVGMAVAAAVGLIWRHPLADLTAKATAPIGAAFTFLALVTGALWGKPMWGTWWVWDARLTSMLVLFFLYLGYIALNNAFDDAARGARSARSWRSSASSTCRSSSFRWIGGLRCISPRVCSVSAGPPSIRACCGRWH
jgi:heme exporter protein C